ncbi:zinc finger protein 41 homolog isoform X1 [Phodopus roborovskii]|uniref:zinc finger protein 41 homolog isoform X1 n=1 Tax=Phodopus roborovskii TaxID=109678 RepID=UPI0021E439B2|nr:zinc finger protein 41 homolog isoform X1 [Phodopus roborovskii]
MEKPAGRKKKTQAPKEEAGVQKATVKGEKAARVKKPTKRSARPRKPRKQTDLSPEDEAHIFDAFDASFKDDFEGVPVFVPFQRKKPYECSECGRIFKHKTDHIRHQRVHTGEKPFKCDQCGKTFRHSSDVTKHLRIHTGQGPDTACHVECQILSSGWPWKTPAAVPGWQSPVFPPADRWVHSPCFAFVVLEMETRVQNARQCSAT